MGCETRGPRRAGRGRGLGGDLVTERRISGRRADLRFPGKVGQSGSPDFWVPPKIRSGRRPTTLRRRVFRRRRLPFRGSFGRKRGPKFGASGRPSLIRSRIGRFRATGRICDSPKKPGNPGIRIPGFRRHVIEGKERNFAAPHFFASPPALRGRRTETGSGYQGPRLAVQEIRKYRFREIGNIL